ncbi:single-stranded DNA-binding protein [Variovorax sp. KK3]|uniref:single-stranded DNA-binding protein n=1 Tax=Variovorax sp. KK3 TaxID=1855728 RepID=UPI00097CAE17|nr:single-stranded DNA-binding protein [Variovorax sp. KK3]
MSTAFVNEVRLIGNLGASPEYRLTGTGTPVASMQVATTYRSGTDKEHTEWHRVVLWKSLAERANKFLRKGSPVYIAGRLQTRQYTDKDGVERWTTEVVAEQMQMLGPKKPNTFEGDEGEGASPASDQRERESSQSFAPEEDDIPF